MENMKLNNNLECPMLGLGTFMLSPEDAYTSTLEALKMGYSLIDTANAYVNELTYHWEGDVLIPDLELEDGSNYQIGKYGRMRQRYLFENYHAMYTHLVLTEKLWKHLEEVDMEYNDMMDMLTVRMAEREGVTEHLKSVDQLGWVRKMNNIRSRAEEVVLHDLIYMD